MQSVKDGIKFARQVDIRIVAIRLGNTTRKRLKQVYENVRKGLLNSFLALTANAEQHDETIATENVPADDKSA